MAIPLTPVIGFTGIFAIVKEGSLVWYGCGLVLGGAQREMSLLSDGSWRDCRNSDWLSGKNGDGAMRLTYLTLLHVHFHFHEVGICMKECSRAKRCMSSYGDTMSVSSIYLDATLKFTADEREHINSFFLALIGLPVQQCLETHSRSRDLAENLRSISTYADRGSLPVLRQPALFDHAATHLHTRCI